jgi:hypothetical protein
MDTNVTGKVRVLPPETPGIPPSVPSVDGKYVDNNACMGAVNAEDVPDGQRWVGPEDEGWFGFYCTRPPHPNDEPHVCHLTDEVTCELQILIVWGGE